MSDLIHILHRHGLDFDKNLTVDDPDSGKYIISDLLRAVETGVVIGEQKENKRKDEVDRRLVYQYRTTKGRIRELGVTMRPDGELYGANPRG